MTWTNADEFRFAIRMGLRKGLSLIRGMRRALTEDEQDRIAGEVADSLRHGWKIEPIQPQVGAGHSGFAEKKSD